MAKPTYRLYPIPYDDLAPAALPVKKVICDVIPGQAGGKRPAVLDMSVSAPITARCCPDRRWTW